MEIIHRPSTDAPLPTQGWSFDVGSFTEVRGRGRRKASDRLESSPSGSLKSSPTHEGSSEASRKTTQGDPEIPPHRPFIFRSAKKGAASGPSSMT